MALNVAQRHRDEQQVEPKNRPVESLDEDVDTDEKISKITGEIEVLQKQMRDVTGMIGAQPTGKTEFFKKKAELQQQLDECSRLIDNSQPNRDEISGDTARSTHSRSNAQGGNAPTKHTVSAQVEEQVRAIEHRMLTESLTLREEKQLLTEIARLKEDPKAVQHGSAEAAASDFRPLAREHLAETPAQLLAHRDKKRTLQAEYAALIAARKTQLAVVPRLHEQREALTQQLGAKIRERAAMRTSTRAADKRFGQQLIEGQKARAAEKVRAERLEGTRERTIVRRPRDVDKLEEKPCMLEIELVEQTMKFCRSFLRPEVAKKSDATVTKHDVPDGAVVIVPVRSRKEADDIYVFPAKRGKAARSKAGKSTSIKHNAETFKFFEKLSIDAPITTDDIPATLEKLEGLLQSYNRKVEAWAERRAETKRKMLDEQHPSAEGERDGTIESEVGQAGEASEADLLGGADGADGGAE